MKLRHLATAPLLAVGLLSTMAAPPASAATPLTAGGAFARTIPFIDGQLYEYECHAAAPGAVSTSITSCALTSTFGTVQAPPATSQGPAAETSGGVSWDPSPNQVCWTAGARYSDGTTQSTSGCSSTSDTAGAGES
jgi:hypothetical protein